MKNHKTETNWLNFLRGLQCHNLNGRDSLQRLATSMLQKRIYLQLMDQGIWWKRMIKYGPFSNICVFTFLYLQNLQY